MILVPVTAAALLVGAALLIGGCSSHPSKSSAKEAADVNLGLGVGYLQQGQIDVALEKLKKALDADPGRGEVHSTLAVAYEQLDEVQLADRHFREALELTSKDSAEYGAVHNNYGAFLCRRNMLSDAQEHFELALQNRLYRTPEAAYENAALCALRRPDQGVAERYFRLALQANPKMPASLYHMAQIQIANGKYLPARAFLQRFHEVAAATPASVLLGVRTERQLGDRKAAAQLARQLRTQFPESEEASQLDELDLAQEVK